MNNKLLMVVLSGTALLAAPVRARVPNYDENKVAPFTLEDPLVFKDGSRVVSAADWERRRAEIVGIFAEKMFGRIPPPPETLVAELVEEGPTLAGLAIRRQYRMWFKADRSGPFLDWLVVIPNRIAGSAPETKNGRVVCENTGRAPVILMLNYKGNHETLNDEEVLIPEGTWLKRSASQDNRPSAKHRAGLRDSTWRSTVPMETIAARGYAFMTCCYGQVSPDVDVRDGDDERLAYTNGVFRLWTRDESRQDEITAIGAWAWALSRGLDLAERIPELDAARAVATGSSRLGKTALLACSRDPRFKVCAPNQTGGGGVPLAKRDFGENVSTEMASFPHWYCRAYAKYIDNEAAMDFDQHLLVASIAPRALLVQGFNKPWFDARGEWLSLKAASPVWTALGRRALSSAEAPADFSEAAAAGTVGYYRRGGEHGLSGYDWKVILDFADREL